MRELSRGRSLTEAAYSAGFASSAHLSAAFKAMFGLAPSALVKLGASFDLETLAPSAR
jgi:AraC-like DNA-binding protein